MWLEADLREIRVFLTLAEELHFGRTAERLGVTRARVSQIIGTLEARLGGRLFDRTSRAVRPTPLGAELAARLNTANSQLLSSLETAMGNAQSTAGVLRIAVTATTDLPVVSRLTEVFAERHPECEVSIEEVDIWGPYEALRRGEVDVLCNWLAVDEPDLTVGPVLERFERVLAVGANHRLAKRTAVTLEDLAGERVNRTPKRYPRALEDAIHPPRTPSGRPIAKTDQIESAAQVAKLIARGEIVTPTLRGLRLWMGREGIVLVPIAGVAPLPLGLIWCAAHENARIRALAGVAAEFDRQPRTVAANGNGHRPRRSAIRPAESRAIELRALGAFLTLTEELHFGRAAERFGVTPSRVSQLIRKLETQLGSRLFDRTSRRVRLTPAGVRLRDGIEPPYRELERAFAAAREVATGVAGTLRIGMHSPVNGGPHMVRIIELFEDRHPACHVSIIDIGLVRNQLETLRTGEVDLLATRLPISQRDVTIGPILSREDRLLAVSSQHPLARLESVDLEDVAPYATADASGLPREMIDAFIPARSPGGRRIRRVNVGTMLEAIMRIALGEIVHPTVPSFLDHFQHPNLVGVPIRDLPATETALVWLTAKRSMKIRAFERAAHDVLANTELAPPRSMSRNAPNGSAGGQRTAAIG